MPRWVWGVAALLYLSAFPYHPKLRSPNELCRLYQTRALWDLHRLDLNATMQRFGRVGDLSVYQQGYERRFYPSKAPLLSFLAVPVYAVLEWIHSGDPAQVSESGLVYWSRLFLTVFPTLAMLFFLTRFLGAYASAPVVNALVLTYALGSLAFSYSLLFMSHQTCAMLVFAAFYSLWRLARGDWPRWGYLAAGAWAGSAVVAEYTAALPVVALAIYGLFTAGTSARGAGRRVDLLPSALLFITGALPWALALMAYHRACFGGALESGYAHLADVAYQPWHRGGFLGIRVPDGRAFFLSFFSPLRGLFTLAPFLTLGLLGLKRLGEREPALFWLTVVILVGYAYFTSSFSYDSWGWTTGPRHLTPLVPFFLAPAALVLESWRKREATFAIRLAAGLCMASVLTTGLLTGVNYIPDDVSNGIGALAIPLYKGGFYPPTVAALTSAAAWPGAGWILGIILAAALVGGVLVPRGDVSLAARFILPVVLVLQALLIQLTTRNDTADTNALKFLEQAWAVRPPAAALISARVVSGPAAPSGR